MMIRYHYQLLAFFSLVGVGSGSVATGKAYRYLSRPKSSPSVLVKQQLSVRGGAGAGLGPITPDLAAKLFTAVYVLQGSAFMLAAPDSLDPYGIKEMDTSQKGSGEYFGTWSK